MVFEPGLANRVEAQTLDQKARKSPTKKKVQKAAAIREEVHSNYEFLAQPEVQTFAAQMQTNHGFTESELKRWLSLTRHRQEVIKLMTPPSVQFKRSWVVYRSRYLDEPRIREGLKFWQENKAQISNASQKLGVPPEIIVSIIGVETVYGRVTGNFKVIDALATLAFDYPRRAVFFKEELEQFLLLARDQGWDPLSVRGSFAGAIGYPQFMPGSIRRHAIDFSGDGRIDLLGSPEDAIGSVANFLINHGWQINQPTHYTVLVSDTVATTRFTEKGIKPEWSQSQLTDAGVNFVGNTQNPPDRKLALIELSSPNQASQWIAAADNFYVITRYNQSSFYAMAVIDLAEELRKRQQVSPSN